MSVPHLAVTMGDPAGIGSEIILKALADSTLTHTQNCCITVVGNRSLLKTTYEYLLHNSQLKPEDLADPEDLLVVDLPWEGKINFGRGDAVSGGFSFACLERAIAFNSRRQISRYCHRTGR